MSYPVRTVSSVRFWGALWLCLTVSTLGLAGCSESFAGCSCRKAGEGGEGGGGGSAGAGGAGAPLGITLAKNHEVLFIGGFMSELYEELSVNLEDEINAALQDSARALNVHIDLPLDKSIDIPIGDTIADSLPRVDLPIERGGFVSFYTQMRYFDAQGIRYQNLSTVSASFDTAQSVEHNAAAILAFLRSTDKQIIIVSHSKGGLDTLDALLDAPELWGDTVIAWVAFQAPFHGSPVADSTFSTANDFLLDAVGGNGQSVEDLKTSTRALYMDANKSRIADLTARIPTISAYSTYEASGTVTGFSSTFASTIFNAGFASQITQIVLRNYRDTPRDLARVVTASTSAAISLIRQRVTSALGEAVATIGLMDLTNVYMTAVLELPNDGLVPSESTKLAGAAHRELALGDHASPVMDVDPLKNFWPVEQRNDVTIELINEVQMLAASETE